MADINTFIQTVKLPVMPEAAHALIRTLNDEDADVVTVRDIIAKDPALTTTLLRMANSALFGLSRSVTTLDNAVSVVGMAQTAREDRGVARDALRDALQAGRPVIDRVHARDHRQQHLRGADVRGRLVAADVLLARLQRQAVGRLAAAVD